MEDLTIKLYFLEWVCCLSHQGMSQMPMFAKDPRICTLAYGLQRAREALT